MKKISFLLALGIVLTFLSCSSPGGEAYLFVEGIANHEGGVVPLHTELTSSGGAENVMVLETKEFYISITHIKIKSREKDWVTIRENLYVYPEEMVRGVNLANGVKIDPYDYNVVLIGYKANWYVNTEKANITNSTKEDIYYAIFYNDVNVYNEVSNQYPNSPSTYWSSSFSIFAGDNKWLYLYFDTEDIAKALTNSSGEITNVYFERPTLNIELR